MNAANGFIIMRKPVFPHIAYIHVIELVLVALRHMSSISSVNEGEKRKKKWRRGTRSAHTTLIARLLDSVAAWMSLIWFKYTDFLNYKIAPSTCAHRSRSQQNTNNRRHRATIKMIMLRARRKNYVNINREPSKPTLQINYITELMKYYTIAAFSIETLKTMDMIATLPSSDQSTACVCVCVFMMCVCLCTRKPFQNGSFNSQYSFSFFYRINENKKQKNGNSR